MDFINLWLVLSAFLFLLVIWIITGIRHFVVLKHKIAKQWENLNFLLRKRHDLLPNFIETLRRHKSDQENLISSLISVRAGAMNDNCSCGDKVVLEHDISTLINKIVFLSIVVPSLRQDMHFVGLRTEIDRLEDEIHSQTEVYNGVVRKYNSHREKFYLKPISLVFGFDLEKIFEFEG